MRIVRDAFSVLAQLLVFPQTCCLCGRPVLNAQWIPLCNECLSSLPRLSVALCPICGMPADGQCSRCRLSPPPFSCARAYGPYQGRLRDLIWCYKFRGSQRLSYALSELMETAYKEHFLDRSLDLLIPVPSHPKRINKRGFDHVGRLTKSLSEALKLPCFRGLRRDRDTQPLFGLDTHERVQDLKGAFSLSDPEALAGKNVLLVDDVMTTGTTIRQVSRLLRNQ